jgi:hypothetical protein
MERGANDLLESGIRDPDLGCDRPFIILVPYSAVRHGKHHLSNPVSTFISPTDYRFARYLGHDVPQSLLRLLEE